MKEILDKLYLKKSEIEQSFNNSKEEYTQLQQQVEQLARKLVELRGMYNGIVTTIEIIENNYSEVHDA